MLFDVMKSGIDRTNKCLGDFDAGLLQVMNKTIFNVAFRYLPQ